MKTTLRMVVVASLAVVTLVTFVSLVVPSLDSVGDDGCTCTRVQSRSQQVSEAAQSTCSHVATMHGPHQYVMAYSFYGTTNTSSPYFRGIEDNALRLEVIFPRWRMRLYHDASADHSIMEALCALQCRHNNLDLCDVRRIPGYGDLSDTQHNAWRFLPMSDALVDAFASRDLDSLPLGREEAAVTHWLQSGLPFHVMRDHVRHSAPIMAGMWGARVLNNLQLMRHLGAQLLSAGAKHTDNRRDQVLLSSIVWPAMAGQVLQHDSYSCTTYRSHGHMTPWPTQREQNTHHNYVGCRVYIDGQPQAVSCPPECRPPKHPDWIMC